MVDKSHRLLDRRFIENGFVRRVTTIASQLLHSQVCKCQLAQIARVHGKNSANCVYSILYGMLKNQFKTTLVNPKWTSPNVNQLRVHIQQISMQIQIIDMQIQIISYDLPKQIISCKVSRPLKRLRWLRFFETIRMNTILCPIWVCLQTSLPLRIASIWILRSNFLRYISLMGQLFYFETKLSRLALVMFFVNCTAFWLFLSKKTVGNASTANPLYCKLARCWIPLIL